MIAELKYRRETRVVGVVDFCLTSITLFVTIFYIASGAISIITMLTFARLENDDLKDEKLKIHIEMKDKAASIVYLSLLLVINAMASIALFFQFTAAFRLLDATKVWKTALDAAKLARYWRDITILSTLYLLIFVIVDIYLLKNLDIPLLRVLDIVLNCFTFLNRMLSIYIVQQFITKLDQTEMVTIIRFPSPSHLVEVSLNTRDSLSDAETLIEPEKMTNLDIR